MSTYYDREGKPITIAQWSELFQDGNRVAYGEVTFQGHELHVSTVWLGIDHSFGRGALQLFETMIFGDVPFNGDLRRYSTEQQALAGHRQTMEALADGRLPKWVCQ